MNIEKFIATRDLTSGSECLKWLCYTVDRDSITYIKCAIEENNISDEYLRIMLDPRFTGRQIRQIYYAAQEGVTSSQMQILANPSLNSIEMYHIREAIERGATNEQLELVAASYFESSLEFYDFLDGIMSKR